MTSGNDDPFAIEHGHFVSVPMTCRCSVMSTLPGSATELRGEIKEATKRLSELQKNSNELKMDRQAVEGKGPPRGRSELVGADWNMRK